MKAITQYYLPTGVWLLIIFLVPTFFFPNNVIQFPFQTDKAVHFAEFFILAYLLNRAFFFGAHITDIRRTFILTFGIIAFIGAVDELYQIYVPGRVTSFFDFSADVIGAVCSLILFKYRVRRKQLPLEEK